MNDFNPEVRIRRAVPEDVPAIAELIQTAMRQYAQISGIPTPLDSQKETQADVLRHVLEDVVLTVFFKRLRHAVNIGNGANYIQ